jgi:hypothetical protein
MGARTLVGSDIDLGARLLRALDEAGIPIDVAYWMLASEWSHWWMVVATPLDLVGGANEASQQILHVLNRLDDADYLLDKLAIVGLDDYWIRARRKQLPRGLPKEGYHLGDFYARDENLEVLDSYFYRLRPTPEAGTNGTTSKRRTQRNSTTSRPRARATSDASQAPGSISG